MKTTIPAIDALLSVVLGFVVVARACAAAARAAEPRPPSFVFILVDDLGQRDLGCYGSTFYETPAIDRLAQDGARFTHAYAASPLCSPSRACILTGRTPARIGITDIVNAVAPAAWTRNTPLRPAPNRDRLAHEETTIAELLKRAGYATFFAGKWHLGPEGWWPESQGFDHNKGGDGRGRGKSHGEARPTRPSRKYRRDLHLR